MTTTNTQVQLPNNIGLLDLYKEEKSYVDMPSQPFMSFQDWKSEYIKEFTESHSDSKMVDVETAVDLTEEEMEAAKKSVEIKPEKIRKIKNTKVVKKSTEPKVKKVKSESKKDKAVAIYKEMMDNGEHPTRKDVIKRFMDEVHLSSAGASTYQYNIKKEFS